jgi:hypothetical protein
MKEKLKKIDFNILCSLKTIILFVLVTQKHKASKYMNHENVEFGEKVEFSGS